MRVVARRSAPWALLGLAGCASTQAPDDAPDPFEDVRVVRPDVAIDASAPDVAVTDITRPPIDARADADRPAADVARDAVIDARFDAGPAVAGISLRDLFAFHGASTGSGATEVHALTGASGFHTFSAHAVTALAPTGSGAQWTLLSGDYNRDGVQDLFAVNGAATGSGTTELHVLDGASGFRVYTAHAATAMPLIDSTSTLLLGDYNADGRVDLYSIAHGVTGSGTTEVHVLDGSHDFDRFLAHAPTVLGPSGAGSSTAYALADADHDGALDLYAITRSHTGSGRTEVHVVAAAGGFRTFLVHDATALGETGTDGSFSFLVADANDDGAPDLYAIQREGTASGSTEVTLLSGADHFQTALLRGPITLAPSGRDRAWQFDVTRPAAVSPTFRPAMEHLALAKAGGANGGGYAYAPSILHDGSGYHLWACNFDNVHLGDSIAYAHSDDGARWTDPRTVLWLPFELSHRLEHACDPSVVRFSPPGDPGGRSFYYLFHSSNSFVGGPGGSYLATVNSVARALTPTGPFGHFMGGDANDDRNWVVEIGARVPVFIQQPAVPCPAADCYGAGEPTVVLRDGTLHLWYADTTATPPGNYHTTSTDGVHWSRAESIGLDLGSVEVKWDPTSNRYVLIGLRGNHAASVHFAHATSVDGVHWTAVREGAALPPYASEIGFSGDERGFTDPGAALFGFAAPYGLSTTDRWGYWELFVSPITLLRE